MTSEQFKRFQDRQNKLSRNYGFVKQSTAWKRRVERENAKLELKEELYFFGFCLCLMLVYVLLATQ